MARAGATRLHDTEAVTRELERRRAHCDRDASPGLRSAPVERRGGLARNLCAADPAPAAPGQVIYDATTPWRAVQQAAWLRATSHPAGRGSLGGGCVAEVALAQAATRGALRCRP